MTALINAENIPTELKELDQWVMWKLIQKKGDKKPRKVPYTVNGTEADTTNPKTWNSFKACINALETGAFNGIGFVFSYYDPFMGVDWDNLRDPETGEWDEGTLEEINGFESYAEVSQSGEGAHSICRGVKPGPKSKRGNYEMYTEKRFFVMTGNHIEGTPITINQSPPEAIKAVYDKIDPPKEVKNSQKDGVESCSMEDKKILSLLMGSAIADKFESLWNGSISGYPSNSEADQALANYIAFYTQDEAQIKRMMRSSGLVRSKWDTHPTYLVGTIQNAINGLTEWYVPPSKKNEPMTNEDGIDEISTAELDALVEKEQTLKLNLTLPDDHFISKYTRWTSSVTDAFYEYQVCGALWLLSACVEGNLCLKLKQETVYPNLWINCLGKSTTSRKTTAVNKAKKIYESIADVTLYNDDHSLEGYLESLAENPIQHFVRDEAAGLLAKMHKQYNEGIFEAECAIYDGQGYKKTLASGKSKKPRVFEVKDPYVTHFYATTPDNYAMIMTLMDFLCGYGFRFLFCSPRYKKERMDLELEEKEDIEAWAEVMTTIKRLRSTIQNLNSSKFSATPEAMALYNKMLRGLEEVCEDQDNEMLNAAIGRNQIHILKIAMLLELGKKEPSFCITVDSIKTAFHMVVSFFLPSLFDVINRLQMDIKSNQVERVIASLRNLGGKARRSKLLQNTNLKKKDFDECIETLIESEVIKVVKEKGKKAVTYILLDTNDINAVLDKVSSFSNFSSVSSLVESTENLTKLTKIEEDNSSRARDEVNVLQTKQLNKLNQLNQLNRRNELKTHTLDKDRLLDILQFCHDWERIKRKSISRDDVVPIAMEYCKKKNYNDVEGVTSSIRRHAKIPAGSDSYSHIEAVGAYQ